MCFYFSMFSVMFDHHQLFYDSKSSIVFSTNTLLCVLGGGGKRGEARDNALTDFESTVSFLLCTPLHKSEGFFCLAFLFAK